MSSRKVRINNRRNNVNTRRLYIILGALLLITLFTTFFVIGDYGLYQIYKLHQEKQDIEQHIGELSLEEDSLRAEKKRLQEDLAYIEKLARERYRMAKRNEKVFRVIKRKD